MEDKKVLFIPESGRVSAYFSKEDTQFINDNYFLIMDSYEKKPVGEFVVKAVTSALSVKKPDSNPDDKKMILKLTEDIKSISLLNTQLSEEYENLKTNLSLSDEQYNDEIKRLTSELNEKNSIIAEQSRNIDKLNNELGNLNHTIDKLNNHVSSYNEENSNLKRQAKLPDNCIIVEFTKFEETMINYVCKEETARTNKNITPDLLLKNIFSHIIINGPHDIFKVPITLSKIRELQELSKQE